MTLNQITTACKICKKKGCHERLMASEMCIGLKIKFAYLLCPNCNSLFIENIPNNLTDYYNRYPWSLTHINEKNYQIQNGFIKRLVLSKIPWLSKLVLNKLNNFDDLRVAALRNIEISKKSRILDIGCGSGGFLFELSKLGFTNCTGVDPHLPSDKIFNNRLYILSCNVASLNPDNKYDIITLHHSLEHIHNVESIITSIDQLLSPNGICIIRLPNIESYSFQEFKENWEGIHPPFHLFLPSKAGMQSLLKNQNLKIVEIRYEQLVESFLFSSNRQKGIYDFDSQGARNFLGDNSLGKNPPPTFTRSDLNYWKKISKQVKKNSTSDFISYYIKHS